MYKVLCDNALMCDSRIEELALINPVVKLEENKAGSFSFIIPPTHPKYDAIQKRKTLVQVYRNDELIFSGVCIEETKDFYKQKKITCEGELTFFNDSIQRPKRYEGYSVRGLLEAYVANHNAQVEENKHFTVGAVTVIDSNGYISCFTNMENTMRALKEDLLDDLGGILYIRHEDGVRYLDYLAESPRTNAQSIKLGKNLMDFSLNLDSGDIATAVIPLGAKTGTNVVEGLEARLTIERVNGGLDYVCSEEAVNTYGWIYKTVEFDNVYTESILKTKGEKYLSETQFENMVIEAKAVDLHLTVKEFEQFHLSDMVRVISAPHGLNKLFRLTKMTINLNSPEKDTITLGKSEKVSLSAKSSELSAELKKAVESIVPKSTMLQEAAKNATALITSAMGGYVVKTNDELLIMDTDDIETAKRVWRWNINGLGYSSTGYKGEYKLAMTMDGKIVADFIAAGTMSADRVRGGTLIAGGEDNGNGKIEVQNKEGTVFGTWGMDGLKAEGQFTSNAEDYFSSEEKSKAVVEKGAFNLKNAERTIGALEKWKANDGDVESIALLAAVPGIRFGFYEKIIVPVNPITEKAEYKEATIFYEMLNLDENDVGILPRHVFKENTLIDGDLNCNGINSTSVATKSYDHRKLYNLGTAEPYFSDMGTDVIGANGTCTIEFEEIFAQTVEITDDYKVFITSTTEGASLYVEKDFGSFTVHGNAGDAFDWIMYCKQPGRYDVRLEKVEGL